ncbi:hypothetical protein NE237_001904 [Protea cynaroides]|uniref:Cysteine-rich PDZ-binding protein n=1 Tax=Protea cynaroides TaxID=273540 RepID=A0A9Q0QYJ9_9MAGN|nr:hypothetical protein NE237_001904 [Protea cynaroides]
MGVEEVVAECPGVVVMEAGELMVETGTSSGICSFAKMFDSFIKKLKTFTNHRTNSHREYCKRASGFCRLEAFQQTTMVCEKCEKKLSKVIVPDKWKDGAKNTTEAGGRKINENKLLSKKHRWTPYGSTTTKCIICKQQVHQDGKYCHTCAYTKGVCAMCGKQVLDTKFYKQSNV